MIKKEKQGLAESEKLREARSAYGNVINKIVEEPLIENTRLSPEVKAASRFLFVRRTRRPHQ